MYFGSLYNIVGELFGKFLGVLGGSLGGMLVVEFVIMFMWLCGFYGVNIVGGIMVFIWYGVMDENWIVFVNYEVLLNIFI